MITANKVLVRVKAAGLNLADLKVIKGGVGRFLHANKFPLFLGYDFSGIVESIGDGVPSFEQGDAVYRFLPYDSRNAQCAYSEYVLVSPAGGEAMRKASYFVENAVNKEAVGILVADGAPDIRVLLALMLRDCVFPYVHHASNGNEAIRIIEQKKPGIRMAFLEMGMSGPNGIEVMSSVWSFKRRQDRIDCRIS